MSNDSKSVRWAWERALRDASIGRSATLAVGFAMATYADPSGGSIFPGIEGLSRSLGLSVSTVKRAQGDLERLGFVAKVGHPNKRKGLAQEYRLTFPDQGSRVTPSPVDQGSSQAGSGVTGDPDQGSRVTPQQTMNNSSINRPSEQGFHPGRMTAAEIVSDEEIAALVAIAPPFDDEPIAPQPSPSILTGLTDRQVASRHRQHDWANREEGLDRFGEPIQSGSPTPRSRRTRYSD